MIFRKCSSNMPSHQARRLHPIALGTNCRTTAQKSARWIYRVCAETWYRAVREGYAARQQSKQQQYRNEDAALITCFLRAFFETLTSTPPLAGAAAAAEASSAMIKQAKNGKLRCLAKRAALVTKASSAGASNVPEFSCMAGLIVLETVPAGTLVLRLKDQKASQVVLQPCSPWHLLGCREPGCVRLRCCCLLGPGRHRVG